METKTLTFTDLVADDLRLVEARMLAADEPIQPQLRAAIEQLLASGGKRLRPILVLLAGGLVEADFQRSVTLAAAIELLHTATLVHDDLIDGALLRRGYPTLNATWDEGATVLMGDYVFAQAARLAAETGSLPIMEDFARTLATIVNGELNQIFGSDSDDVRQSYFDRAYAKTGSLFELATRGPALLAQVQPPVEEQMAEFGRQLGTAFQIVDDILDFTGSPQEVGKPVASDLRRGLLTLPTICHLESHPEHEPQVRSLMQGALPLDDQERLIESIRTSGGVESALQEAADLVANCQRLLGGLGTDRPENRALSELAQYALDRTQ